jgi:3-deoxy-D-manno-octulosonic-acid transferase
MILLYNLSIFLLDIGARLASLFHPKASAFVTGRKGLFNRIKQSLSEKSGPVVWMHCASLGEFEQGRPIMEALKLEFPHYKIFLTFFSPSGYEIRKNYPGADFVFYLPWDTAANSKKLVDILNPSLAIFVKYEFWYHYSQALKNRGIPLISISSIFRDNQLFFKPWGSFSRKTLKNFAHFFVQNQESVQLLNAIGIRTCTRSGDTRFDRVKNILRQTEPIMIAHHFKNDQKVFVVGSCWPEDLEVLIPFIDDNRLKFIIAPHEIAEGPIRDLEKALHVRSIRFSQAQGKKLEDYSVLIIDNIGLLSRLYRYGEFAYIGGAYGKGLHNILEAACYGIPLLFGNKNFEKFQEAVDLINRGGAFAVADYPDLKEKFEMLNVPESFLLACEVTRQYVDENLGATEKIMQYVRTLLSRNKNVTVL